MSRRVGAPTFSRATQLGDVAQVYADSGDNESRLWKLLAYAGRYGHQPLHDLKQLTCRELGQLVRQLNILVQEENQPSNASHPED